MSVHMSMFQGSTMAPSVEAYDTMGAKARMLLIIVILVSGYHL